MKIVVVGATGVVGKAVVAGLKPRHEIVKVGKTRGEHQVDIKDSASIAALFKRIGKFDALVSTVGKVHFGEFADMTEKEFAVGLKDKLMGQVNLVLLGRDHVNDDGSFTLTSGLLSHDPIRRASAPAWSTAPSTPSCAPPPSSCPGACASIPSAPACSKHPPKRWRTISPAMRRSPASAWRGPM